MTAKEQYRRAYQCLRAAISIGISGTYWGDKLLAGLAPEIIGKAAISLASRYQRDKYDRRFVRRCQVASPVYTGKQIKWVYDPSRDGIPF